MRCTDRLPTLPFEPLCILAMKMNIACIGTWVHQNLHVGKTLWDKTLTCKESYQFNSSSNSALYALKNSGYDLLPFEYVFL
jgi:hypothetical protein